MAGEGSYDSEELKSSCFSKAFFRVCFPKLCLEMPLGRIKDLRLPSMPLSPTMFDHLDLFVYRRGSLTEVLV